MWTTLPGSLKTGLVIVLLFALSGWIVVANLSGRIAALKVELTTFQEGASLQRRENADAAAALRRAFESDKRQALETMIAKVAGPNNVRAEVTAEMDPDGIVMRLSVAVLINYFAKSGDSQSARRPPSIEEMELIANLARTAVGFDVERGDTLDVVAMPFAKKESKAK